MESQPSNNSIVKINNNNHNHNNNTNTNNTNINHTSNNQTQTVATQQQQQPQQNNNVVAPAPSFTPTSNNNQNVNIALQSQQQQHNNNVIAPTPVFTPTPIAGVSGGPAAVPAPTPATAAAHPMYSAAMHSSNLYMPAAGVPQPASVYPMIPTHIPSNVYVNNVTANVNLHGWPHTVPAYIQGAAPHYIHSEVSPDQNGPVMQALPVSLAPTNAIVGPGNSNSTGPANMSARGSRRGRGRGGSGGSRRGDYNNQRHPPPEGSPVPQQAQQNQDQMLQSMGQQQQQPSQQMDAQLMAGGPHAYAPHPQYAHASPYPYAAAYPTFFATQNPMIHAAQATAQQAANTPLYVPMFANAHQLYSYVGGSFMYSPVMNPPEYHQFMPGDDGQGDERHNPEGMMSQMWHTQQVYSEEYGMNPEMHSAGGDELNQSVASSETPSMLSPNYPIYGQQLHEMQHQMGVMQIFDEPQMGQMQSMHTGTAVTQIEDDLVECGGQPGTIQMVPAGALIAAGPMQMPGDTQLIHHGHVQHPAPPHHMMQIAMEPQMPAVQPQQHQHGGGAENVNIDNGNNNNNGDNNNAQNNEVTNLHAVDSMASLNEVGQQSTENIAQDYQLQQQQQQQSQQQHEQPMQQHQQPTAVEFNEVYSNNHLHMTDGGGELIDYVPNSEELALAPAAVATGVPTQQQQMQTSPPLQKYPQQQRHEQQQVQHQHQQKSQQPMQQPYNRHEQQPQQLNQHQSQVHQQTQQPHQQHHSQQQQQQQHQPNYHPHQQHQPYEQRRQPQVYNTQSRRKYTSDNSNNNSNAYQQHQPHVPNNNSNTNSDSSSQTTRSMWWTNSSQHKKSTASVAVTATPTTNTNNNNANMSGANKQSSSYSHLTKTFTNQQHHFHQQQNYHPHQHHQPQMRNHSVMKTPTSPVSVAAPPLSNTNAAANSTANLATSTIATATVTIERQNSQGDQVKANYVSNNNANNSNSNAINNIGSGNTNTNTTTPAATSTASTTAAPHQFPVQAQQQQRQQQTTALVDKQYPGFTSSKKTAAASATTTSANGSNAPLAMNLAPPASTATVATSSPAGGSWASLFNKTNNNVAASAAPAANSTQSTSSNNSNNNNSISNIGISSNSPALPASKPIAMVAPYECSIPVIPTPPIVTPGGMSYSAASAQGITPPAATVAPKATKTESTIRVLPAAAAAVRNNANLDEYTLKFSEFLTKAKTDLSPISLRPRGLTNPSNYCYINSILQALLGCAPFYNLMRSIPKQAAALSEVKTPTVNAMISFFSNFSALPSGLRLRANKGPKGKDELGSDLQCDFAFEPNEIYRLWIDSRKEYVEGRQEDAEEFLGYVLNKLNDEMLEIIKLIAKPNAEQNGQNDQSENEDGDEWQMICNNRNKGSVTRQTDFGRTPLSDIFRGELRSRLQREGEHSTDDIQPFFTLQLNIEKAASVKEALEILVGRDQLEGVTGSKSKQEVVAWQQMTLEKLPIILILHLKWFDYRSDGCTKILKKVEFPVELKIDAKILASKKYSQKQRTYRLFAVVYHEGKEATKGHYITDVYHTGYSSWLRYNDSAVKPVSENEVLYPKTPRVPYLLYYRRCDTVPQQAASATGGNSGSYMNPSNHSGK